jgi:hypothetical protein
MLNSGARCRTRTGTLLRITDFKSVASTNSAKRALTAGRQIELAAETNVNWGHKETERRNFNDQASSGVK